ncbi:hypothetical protein N7517_003739 [Penicillium concentricum]|uniref:D-xylulose reductase n=1 Tax=Penicillium concentricum TaxID=293559 RepID=A0A9W9S458_9EURO|nr:uncharacterized protein N7517_003739 [Penicillium concentricum]KAJ5371733.1 hypothetical protein N7517_003739 [Penicillium concentricum]
MTAPCGDPHLPPGRLPRRPSVHFWLHGGIKKHVSATNPLVVCHEASGTVHAIGSAVTTLKPGDEIAIEAGFACHFCIQCKKGRYSLCPRMKFAADPPHTHGFLSRFVKIPADCCYKISGVNAPFRADIGLDEAVLIEPMAVAVHSVRQGGVKPGDKVVVFGAGTVGLLCAAVARQFGAIIIVSVDRDEDKLTFAEGWMLPKRTVVFTTEFARESSTAEQNATDLRNFDVAIEATGAEQCIQTALRSLRVGGSFVQTGLGSGNVNFPMATVLEHELTLKGSFRYGPGDFKLALEMVMLEKVNLKPLITKTVPFKNTVEAWEIAKRGEGIKTLIRVGL